MRYKFRAWDKEEQKMMQVTLMDFSEWWVECWYLKNGMETITKERNSFNNEETDRHILMQFTGLKDKNDKELYENDIVSFNGIGSYKIVYDGYKYKAKDFYRSSNDNPTDIYEEANLVEVIGNIYEHPKLLETKERS